MHSLFIMINILQLERNEIFEILSKRNFVANIDILIQNIYKTSFLTINLLKNLKDGVSIGSEKNNPFHWEIGHITNFWIEKTMLLLDYQTKVLKNSYLFDCFRTDQETRFEICNNNTDIGCKVMSNISKIITKHLIKSNHKVLKLTTAFSLLIDD